MSAPVEEEDRRASDVTVMNEEDVAAKAAADETKADSQEAVPVLQPPEKQQGKEKRPLSPEELAIINDPAKFREYCFRTQRSMLENLKEVHVEQKAQKAREGELAAHVALNALENAKLHEQFKNKSVSRAIAKRMNELAAEAGVDPIDLEAYSVEHLGPEGGMANAADENEQKVKDAGMSSEVIGHSEKQGAGKRRQKENQNEGQVGKDTASSSRKRDGSGTGTEPTAKKPKEDPRHSVEDNSPDPDGITLPGNIHSRENNPVITRWGIRGTTIKGRTGCIIRIPPGGKLSVPPTVSKPAKAAAADVASKKERLSSAKHFGETIYKYVEVVLNAHVEKKNEHAPFLFEELKDVPEATTARDFNNSQPVIWAELLRDAYMSMKLQDAALGVPLAGAKHAVELLRSKVKAMGRPPKKAVAKPEKDDVAAQEFEGDF